MKKLYYVCDSLTPEDFDSNYEKTIVEYIKFVKNENRNFINGFVNQFDDTDASEFKD